jgi:hypothetical protein
VSSDTSTQRVPIEFDSDQQLVDEYAARMNRGFVMARGVMHLGAGAPCDVVLMHPMTGHMLSLRARVAEVDAEQGIVCKFEGFGDSVHQQIRDFIDLYPGTKALRESVAPAPAEPEAAESPEAAEADEGSEKDPLLLRTEIPAHVHQRLRSLPVHEVHKIARSGQMHERVALERIYGKAVWEPLLQNPNLTAPEVARIAKMGSLPKPLIDMICNHAGWLTKSLVRRALLSNPRLAGRALTKVLRALPKNELKMVPTNAAYPYRIRDAATRLLGS